MSPYYLSKTYITNIILVVRVNYKKKNHIVLYRSIEINIDKHIYILLKFLVEDCRVRLFIFVSFKLRYLFYKIGIRK